MAQTLLYKVGDTAPNIPITCTYEDGTAVPLSGATVNFYIVNEAGSVTNTGHTQCTITGASTGEVVYDLVSGDFASTGTHTGLTKVTSSGGEIMSEKQTHIFVVGSQYGGQ